MTGSNPTPEAQPNTPAPGDIPPYATPPAPQDYAKYSTPQTGYAQQPQTAAHTPYSMPPTGGAYTRPDPTQAYATPNAYPTTGNPPIIGCGFAQAVARYWQGYVRFSGRASRSEYWFAFLFTFLVGGALSVLGLSTSGTSMGGFITFLTVAWGLATLLPNLAISWRRLHDSSKSGALMFIVFGLYLIAYILLIFGLVGAIGGAINGSTGVTDWTLMGGSIGMLVTALLVMLAGRITEIILMCLPSNPAGARFDR